MRDEIIIFNSSFEIAFSVFIVSGVFEVYNFLGDQMIDKTLFRRSTCLSASQNLQN